jgi:hypothetical protein
LYRLGLEAFSGFPSNMVTVTVKMAIVTSPTLPARAYESFYVRLPLEW